MSQHLTSQQLHAFTVGEMGPEVATLIAEHLDQCPDCKLRATLMDPLHSAFTASEEPACPPDLADHIIAKCQGVRTTPWTEIFIGSGLLLAATILVFLTVSPTEIMIESAIWATTLKSASHQLSDYFSPLTLIALALTALFALSSSIAVHPFLVNRRVSS